LQNSQNTGLIGLNVLMNPKKNIMIEEISLDVISKKIKNLNLRITPPSGNIVITAPHNYPEEKIIHFVRSKIEWIRKHQSKMKSVVWKVPVHYLSGEGHCYLGKAYRLEVVERKGKQGVIFNDKYFYGKNSSDSSCCQNLTSVTRKTKPGMNRTKETDLERKEKESSRLVMVVRPGSNRKNRQAILDAWYKEELKRIILPIIPQYEEKMNVHAEEWRIKKMKTKWGTCNITKKRIWLNLELAQKPLHFIEHVIVHELAHFIERKHNAKFKKLMEKYNPNNAAKGENTLI